MEPKGTGAIEYLRELRRIPLLGTWVNKARERAEAQKERGTSAKLFRDQRTT
jgi:hypothetical protein